MSLLVWPLVMLAGAAVGMLASWMPTVLTQAVVFVLGMGLLLTLGALIELRMAGCHV